MLQHSSTLASWNIQIFQVADGSRQRLILQAFDRIGRPGVIAQGSRSGADWFVIVESGTIPGKIHAGRVVRRIDPGARRTYESGGAPQV